MTADWLAEQRNAHSEDHAEQAAIRKRAMSAIGAVQGGDPARSARTSQLVREIIARKHEKESRAFARNFRKNARRAAGGAD